jgi:serine O-acetyltransferase
VQTSLPAAELARYLAVQIERAFPDGRRHELRAVVDTALTRVEHAFGHIVLRGYSRNGEATFSHLQGDQYAVFLYFASHAAWRDAENEDLASRLFLLNKSLNGLVCMYDTVLPDVFVLVHTVGTVLGKANYGNYFVAAQNVTVGTDRDQRPTFGERVVLYGGSTVIGAARIGNRVTVATNAVVRSCEIPSRSIVAGAAPELVVKAASRDVSDLYFGPA